MKVLCILNNISIRDYLKQANCKGGQAIPIHQSEGTYLLRSIFVF